MLRAALIRLKLNPTIASGFAEEKLIKQGKGAAGKDATFSPITLESSNDFYRKSFFSDQFNWKSLQSEQFAVQSVDPSGIAWERSRELQPSLESTNLPLLCMSPLYVHEPCCFCMSPLSVHSGHVSPFRKLLATPQVDPIFKTRINHFRESCQSKNLLQNIVKLALSLTSCFYCILF